MRTKSRSNEKTLAPFSTATVAMMASVVVRADTLRTRRAKEGCGIPIGLETTGFQEVKKREISFRCV